MNGEIFSTVFTTCHNEKTIKKRFNRFHNRWTRSLYVKIGVVMLALGHFINVVLYPSSTDPVLKMTFLLLHGLAEFCIIVAECFADMCI